MKAVHIIAAAGSGRRFGSALPKQFCPLPDGRPLLMTTIERMRAAARSGDSLLLVLSACFIDEWLDLCAAHAFSSPAIVEGGDTRWESVKCALQAAPAAARVVTVHDGARPVVTPEVLRAAVEAVEAGAQGAIPVVELTDSVRMLGPDGRSSRAIDRASLRAVQTPQAFDARLLRQAYALPWRPEFTDDASVMEAAGFTDIRLIAGSPDNIKVTHPADLDRAARLLGMA